MMIYTIIIYSICLIGLLIASFTDIKTREVPDWLNFSLIASGIGINLIATIIIKDPRFIIDSFAGLACLFIIAWIMFYTGQWGGGDSKILMGLGALVGIDLGFRTRFMFDFLINSLIIGAVYGIIWSIVLTTRNWKNIKKQMNVLLRTHNSRSIKKALFMIIIGTILYLIVGKDASLKFLFSSISTLLTMIFYLWAYIKSVESSAMLKLITPDKLTEGDWIAEDVIINKKLICGPKDLGITKSQIKKLIQLYKKRKVRKILIKEGIPFVPSFLITFIVTILFDNLLIHILSYVV